MEDWTIGMIAILVVCGFWAGLIDSVVGGGGLIMGIPMVIGAVVGSRMAIRKGAAYIRPLFITVTVILIGKQIWDTMH